MGEFGISGGVVASSCWVAFNVESSALREAERHLQAKSTGKAQCTTEKEV